jgi:hypothetical protein
MGSCATGDCPRSKANGGKGCYLCDVVTPGNVTYEIPHRGGPIVVRMQSIHRKDAVKRGEKQLTTRQAKKRKDDK